MPSSIVQLAAMSGISAKSVLKATRPLKISTTMPADVVSLVRCGSSVGGSLHSLRKTPPDSDGWTRTTRGPIATVTVR